MEAALVDDCEVASQIELTLLCDDVEAASDDVEDALEEAEGGGPGGGPDGGPESEPPPYCEITDCRSLTKALSAEPRLDDESADELDDVAAADDVDEAADVDAELVSDEDVLPVRSCIRVWKSVCNCCSRSDEDDEDEVDDVEESEEELAEEVGGGPGGGPGGGLPIPPELSELWPLVESLLAPALAASWLRKARRLADIETPLSSVVNAEEVEDVALVAETDPDESLDVDVFDALASF